MLTSKTMDVLLDLWAKADARAFAAELRIMELERHCLCSRTMRLPPRNPPPVARGDPCHRVKKRVIKIVEPLQTNSP